MLCLDKRNLMNMLMIIRVKVARNVAQRMGTIIPVEDINELGGTIKNYDEICANMGNSMFNNNELFCENLKKIVDSMF